MNREIKFRAWDGSKMYLPEYCDKEDFHLLPDGTIVETHEYGYERHELTSPRGDNWLVMQYTGLKDKAATDIYEDDICRAMFRDGGGVYFLTGQIIMDDFMWCIQCTDGEIYSINRIHNIEVIGNIHQNPDLLK